MKNTFEINLETTAIESEIKNTVQIIFCEIFNKTDTKSFYV